MSREGAGGQYRDSEVECEGMLPAQLIVPVFQATFPGRVFGNDALCVKRAVVF